jgi:hypothetical protein
MMADTNNYIAVLTNALEARADWLEKSELVKMKDELRTYQSSFSALYTIFIKKALIDEDPYKQEVKIGELEVPDSGSFSDAERQEQLSIRLSNFDNQLDFLVNFYQFGVEFLNMDRIKRILGLVRYVDWPNLSLDSQFPVTKAVAEISGQAKAGLDQLALSVISESLGNLSKSTALIIGYLKELTDYQKESFKLRLRTAVTSGMGPQDAAAANIKKKFVSALPGKPYYADLVEEVIKEDYTKEGPVLRERVLKSLQIQQKENKIAKPKTDYKSTLLQGLEAIGSSHVPLAEIAVKADENEVVLTERKKNLWEKIKDIMQQMMHKEPEEIIYAIEYIDPVKGVPVKENLNFRHFRGEMDKKTRILAGFTVRGSAKLEALGEEQLMVYLEKNIREVQNLHKTLAALDEYFKTEAPNEVRNKIRGVKPELATIKNAIVRANQLRHEYASLKEEENQMKRLGINPGEGQ